jgi:hypothetical protein
MRIREVLSQAYSLTIKNPILWLFGLVMLGGFNLSLINFFSIVPGGQWKSWPLRIDTLFNSPLSGWISVLFVIAATFVILNVIKIIFIVVMHNMLHQDETDLCLLCTKKETPLPYLSWLGRVLLASLITIGFTLGVMLATNSLIHAGQYDGPVVVMINIFFIALVTGLVGIWNIFTSLFVVMYDLNFKDASNAALDLIVLRFRQLVEFALILSIIHAGAVLVTNGFIIAWRHGLIGGFYGTSSEITHFVSIGIIMVWFALNNAFFNIAFVVFFDKIVRSIPVSKVTSRLLHANRLN